MSEPIEGGGDDAAPSSEEPGQQPGTWVLPRFSFSIIVSVIALSISVSTFYLTRVRPADVSVVPGNFVAVRWDGIGAGTDFNWINSKLRLELLFANSGAQRTVVRGIRMLTNGSGTDDVWQGRYDVTGEARAHTKGP